MSEFRFSNEQFAAMFPYYICLTADGRIESCGNYIPQLCGIEIGAEFTSLFECKKNTDKADGSKSGITLNEVIIIQSLTASHINFKGKFERIDNGERIMFFGTPSYVIGNEEIDMQLKLFNNTYESKLFAGNKLFIEIKYDSLEAVVDFFSARDKNQDSSSKNRHELSDAITVSDNDGIVIWCNRSFEMMSGRPFEEVVGKRPRDAIYGKRSVYIDKNFVDHNVQRGEPFYFENIGYTKEGSEFWFGVVVYPVFNSKKEIIGRVHLLKDITVSKQRELQIEENENLLSLALEASAVGAWSYDRLADEVKVSDLLKSLIGLKYTDAVLPAHYAALVHPDDRTKISTQIIPGLSKDNPSFAFEVRIKVNATYRYFNARGKCLMFGSEGNLVKLVGTIRDVTEEKNKVLLLEEQKQFYYNLIDKIPADIVIFSTDHKYQFINKGAVKDDVTRNWLIGKTDYDYVKYKGISSEFADKRRAIFDTAMQTREQASYVEHKINNGKNQYLIRFFSPLLNDSGEPELVIGYGVDITEQVEKEQYARLQEKRISDFLDIAKDGIFSCSMDGTVKVKNYSFLKIMRIPEQTVGQINFFNQLVAEELLEVKDKLTLLINTGRAQTGVFTLKRDHEHERKYIDYTFIQDANNETEGFVGRISDITDIVLRERHMQEIIENEVQLNKNKSQFIHITSHELRTPLTIIQSNSELLEIIFSNPALMAKKNPLILTQRIIKEVELMTDILNQLMMVSKIESGSVDLNITETDIKTFVGSVTASFRPYSDGRQLEVSIDNKLTTWEIDTKIMKHALVNLFSNAFKYSYDKKNPELRVMLVDGKLTFVIKDYGIGIPEADQKSLFQNFYRASNVGVISGTGIGLMVVAYAVQKHNGTIELNSAVNEGSEFTIAIP